MYYLHDIILQNITFLEETHKTPSGPGALNVAHIFKLSTASCSSNSFCIHSISPSVMLEQPNSQVKFVSLIFCFNTWLLIEEYIFLLYLMYFSYSFALGLQLINMVEPSVCTSSEYYIYLYLSNGDIHRIFIVSKCIELYVHHYLSIFFIDGCDNFSFTFASPISHLLKIWKKKDDIDTKNYMNIGVKLKWHAQLEIGCNPQH